MDREPQLPTKAPDRVFFIVDRTRLMQETDELKNAIVVYRPESDLRKPSLEQRCSQLIGISFLTTNLTGQVPKYIRLRQTGFAIKQLGQNYIMGLSSKVDEPKSCVTKYLTHMHDSFLFYYGSPQQVMEMSLGEWDIFTLQMSNIFDCILEFTFRETHSVPAMFSPLTYTILDQRKEGTQLFLQAQRLLRLCQVHRCIIGGCLFHNGEILSSQLPSLLVEKLLLVASGGVELNSRSVLEGQITPESVWVINVYLDEEELTLTNHSRRDHMGISVMYSSLTPNPVSSAMLLQDRAHKRPQVLEKLGKKISERSLSRSNRSRLGGSGEASAASRDASISVSVSRNMQVPVAPLKRAWSRGQSISSDSRSDPFTSSVDWSHPHVSEGDSSASFSPPPPLPPRTTQQHLGNPNSSAPSRPLPPPPLPPRLQPPPVPQHTKGPTVPPRKESAHNFTSSSKHDSSSLAPPQPPPRNQSRSSSSSPLLPPPVPSKATSQGTSWIYDDNPDDLKISELSKLEEISPCISRTLSNDSDGSEGFATPPPFHSPSAEEHPSPLLFNGETTATETEQQEKMDSQKLVTAEEPENRGGSDVEQEVQNGSLRPTKLDFKGTNREATPNLNGTDTADHTGSLRHSREHVSTSQQLDEPHVQDNIGDSHNGLQHVGTPPNDDMILLKRSSSDSGISAKETQERVRKKSRSSTVSDCASLDIVQALSESPGSLQYNLGDEENGVEAQNKDAVEQNDEGSDDDNDDDDDEEEEEEEEKKKNENEKMKEVEVKLEGLDAYNVEDSFVNNSPLPQGDAERTLHTPSSMLEGVGSSSDSEAPVHMTLRPRSETWVQREYTQRGPVMTKKCLYIQRCVNTVVALLADTDLPEDHTLIKSMWKLLIGQLLQLNNSVEGCLIEKESVYSPDVPKADTPAKQPTPQAFQAVHSNMTGMCAVSSLTAPYQFRHAVRRAHQEYALNPDLRQMSFYKEHCKMVTQNVMGRETYFQPSRVNNIDTLTVHGQLEKYARTIKRQPASMGLRINFL